MLAGAKGENRLLEYESRRFEHRKCTVTGLPYGPSPSHTHTPAAPTNQPTKGQTPKKVPLNRYTVASKRREGGKKVVSQGSVPSRGARGSPSFAAFTCS